MLHEMESSGSMSVEKVILAQLLLLQIQQTFLQPCDQHTNKKLKAAMRDLRDKFCRLSVIDTRKPWSNLACGVYAFDQITEEDIRRIFEATGIFSFQSYFAEKFKTHANTSSEKLEAKRKRVIEAGGSSLVHVF